MVMDATPSPQSVGREFVRQYYTLLNKAPNHLHRFYNHQSSFVHGGLEPASGAGSPRDCPVIGQKQIHNKIQQLNFRDCHAKISQVDAQDTLGNGVVVQVTGELSNDGQPMRRFTQTFVLAPQAPKKYYVHNDIFRYQDVVWDDEQQDGPEQDSDARSEEVHDPADATNGGGVPGAQDAVVQSDLQQQQQQMPQSLPGAVPEGPGQAMPPPQPQQFFSHPGQVKPAPGLFPSAPTMNGVGVGVGSATVSNAGQAQPAPVPVQAQPAEEKGVAADEAAKAAAGAAAPEKKEAPFKPAQPETFASLVKSGGAGLPSTARVLSSRPAAAPVQSVSVVSSQATGQAQGGQSRGGGGAGDGVGNAAGRERRSSTNNAGQREQYGDAQQLFVGNIPHHATEDDLKAMFGKYGAVADLRIFAKQSTLAGGPGGKGATGRVPQNYGFVTFKDAESAQAVLANPNICFPEDSPDGQKLNIEEKMQRVGDRDRRSMGGMNGGGMNGGSRGMGRGGGMQGSGGMMRNSGPRGSGGEGRNGTGPRGGGGGGAGGGGGSYNRSQVIRNGSAGSGLTATGGGGGGSGGGGNTYGGRR